MDQALLVHLTDAQRQRYNTLEKLFESDGWKLIIDFVKAEAANQESRMINAPSWDVHRHAAGARAVYKLFEGLPDQFENEFTGLAQEAASVRFVKDEQDYE